jgi:hypothetical protein
MSPRNRLTLLLVTLLLSTAGAAEAAPPPPSGLELGARVMFGAGNYGIATMAGLQIGGRVVPHLSLGGYADMTALFGPVRYKCGGCDAPLPGPVGRFGFFADIHALPRKIVDPYFRLAIGAERTDRTWAEGELGFGLDIRFHHWAVGPYVAAIRPVDGAAPWWYGLGGRAVVAF